MSIPALEFHDLGKSAAINLPGTPVRYAAGTPCASGFNVTAIVDECAASAAKWMMQAGGGL